MASIASIPARRNSWDASRVFASAHLIGERLVQQQQQELLRVWSGERRTAIFITHNIEQAILLGRPRRRHDRASRPDQGNSHGNLPWPRDVTSAEFNDTRRRIGLILVSEAQATFAAMQGKPGGMRP